MPFERRVVFWLSFAFLWQACRVLPQKHGRDRGRSDPSRKDGSPLALVVASVSTNALTDTEKVGLWPIFCTHSGRLRNTLEEDFQRLFSLHEHFLAVVRKEAG